MSNQILEKIYSFIGDETANQLGVHTQLRFLHHELSSMRGAMEDVADIEDLDNRTKAWRNEVSELYYDTEDCIDDFRHRVEEGSPSHGGQAGLMRRARRLLETLMARYQISRKIKELRTRAQEANDRRTRYKPDECVMSRSARVSVDPRITALYAETSSLVGIDAPKKEVVRLLTEVDGASLKELRVVSIVGFGGLGKTTLANEVYRDLRDNLSGNAETSFSCTAIISVSQRPDRITLLKSLFSKVSGQSADHAYDLHGLIDIVREYLQGKRYLLVIDDIWDPSEWEIIKCAFPESHCGSRVLTTTRIESVAVACCNYQWKFVYRMKPLDDHHSRQLFLRRIFGSGDSCPEPFEGVCEKILQKCGGLPLAIITIASLLASQQTRSMEQWKYVLDSIRHNLGLNSTLEGMRQILNLSYIHLPHPLKPCLLYIGMYPEDYEIQREDLVTQCVAEGFISGVDGSEAVEVAGSFLNELVNRSMIIQRVKHGARGEHISYRVHDMVLDLILCKSTEENFLCAVQNLQAASTRLSGQRQQQQHKARRLSLQFHDRNLGAVESAGRINLPHVRSLIVFKWPAPTLELFELKFLRVLHIVLAADNLDLTLICRLFQLRYLCIRGKHNGLQLPVGISGLKHLQVLDVTSGLSSTSGIPRDVIYLPGLLHLQFPLTAVYPDGIGNGNMRCLHTLLQFDASKQSVANMMALGELLNLRVLDLWITDARFAAKEAHMDALMSSLEKLISCNLKTLSIFARDHNVGRHSRWNSLRFSCSHQAQLERLYLYLWCPRMPGWVCQLRALSVLKINVVELRSDDVAVLAGLPALSRLILDVRRSSSSSNSNVGGGQQGIVFSADAPPFRLLGYLRIPYHAEAGVTFEAGSMAQVETLRFPVTADDVQRWGGVRISGIQHLPNLKQVLVDLRYGDCDESERPVIRAAVRRAFDAHSAPSSIHFEFY